MVLKKHVWFGACFLVMSTAGALLLTWSVWWLAVVGPSMPARRPFFAAVPAVPALVAGAGGAGAGGSTSGSGSAERQVFENVLPGGWAPANSAVRVAASAVAVLAALSFAFVATLCAERRTRACFTAVLALVSLLGAAATALDAWQLAVTAMECAAQNCVSYVPAGLANSKATCRCAPDGWFWVTLAVDAVLLTAALACLALTIRPMLAKR